MSVCPSPWGTVLRYKKISRVALQLKVARHTVVSLRKFVIVLTMIRELLYILETNYLFW